ncbi:MAG: flagellar protein FliT [Rhodocyclaceae bacterium]
MNATRPDPIEQLQALEARYRAMLELAIANDWDALANAGRECVELRQSLERVGGLVANTPDAHAAGLMQTLIGSILELDAQIREHTVPALESTRKLLAGQVKKGRIQKAYGAQSPFGQQGGAYGASDGL